MLWGLKCPYSDGMLKPPLTARQEPLNKITVESFPSLFSFLSLPSSEVGLEWLHVIFMVLFCNWLIKGPLYKFFHIKISVPFVRSMWKQLQSIPCGSLSSPKWGRNNNPGDVCFVLFLQQKTTCVTNWGCENMDQAESIQLLICIMGSVGASLTLLFLAMLNYWSSSEKCSFSLSSILTELKHNSNPHIWRAGITFAFCSNDF